VRFGIFYEHQLPRPWSANSEAELLRQALEQVELADRLGFDYVWEVEHHFLEEYSHSSAPELFLTAVAMVTTRTHVCHGIATCVPQINQGLVRFHDPRPGATEEDHDRRTDEVMAAINATGEAFFTGTTWRGQRCMRVSVSSWRTTAEDVDRAVAAAEQSLDANTQPGDTAAR